jgi:hypothetical protein
MGAVNERDRDRSIERLLRQALRTAVGAEVSGPCLDAETLAAWADRGLTASDLAKVETHLSECSLSVARYDAGTDSPGNVRARTLVAAKIRIWLVRTPDRGGSGDPVVGGTSRK